MEGKLFLDALVFSVVVYSVRALHGGGGERGNTSCTTTCCETAPIGGCDLVSAMNGYCCEPLAEKEVISNDPQGPDQRFFPRPSTVLGRNYTFAMPWAESIFAKTYNESFSNPGYLSGQSVKHGQSADAYYQAAMKFDRPILVYIPAEFKVSTEGAKVQVIMDGQIFCGPNYLPSVATALENSISSEELPHIVLVCVASGSVVPGEGGGRLRDFEYETMSNRNARFFAEEVLPAVEANVDIQAAYPGFRFSTDRKDRATLGCSSSGAASIIASWFAPEYFHRALGFSATLVQVFSTPCTRNMSSSQCESATPSSLKEGFPRGAWDLHSGPDLISSSAKKDVRIYHQAGQYDILGCSYYKDQGAITNCTEQFTKSGNNGHFNIRLANNRSAARLVQKGYQTRFVYSLNQSHCTVWTDPLNGGTTIFDGIVWAWRDEQSDDPAVYTV